MRTLIVLFCCIMSTAHAQRINFDDNWRFYRGAAQGAEDVKFDDSNWRTLDLPHDWSIEDLPGTTSPFNPGALSQVSGGFTTNGTGWYRKHFHTDTTKRTFIQFDGIYMNSEVWINGKKLGKHPYGYTSFWYDISPYLSEENVIAVKVRNEGENSRWYSGSGIYRHVWLHSLDPVHIDPWGVSITTPEINKESATIRIQTKLQTGFKQITMLIRILDANNKEVAVRECPATANSTQDIVIKNPVLWSVNTPVLYKAITTVFATGIPTDSLTTTFGIRTIAFDAAHGFRLNGESLKLKGGCVHHDNGPLGAKAYDRAEERKVELLKASGYNAIRCAHNPPSPAFLDACDRLGMLVIDEAFDAWQDGKNPEDYHLYFKDWWQRDIESMIYRDRNHPSIIMWSIGNEIPHREKPEVAAVAMTLRNFIRGIDTTRPVTCGVNGIADDKDAFLAALDIAGYNYAPDKYVTDHQRVPARVMMGTESFPLDAGKYWKAVEDNSWVIGDFVWTAFDYIGEASIGWLGYMEKQSFYPWNLAYCGDIDVCGWKRPQSYYRDALWMKDQLSIFVQPPQPSFKTNPDKVEWSRWEWNDVTDSWNWKGWENKPLKVVVYTSSDEPVELFLNEQSLGKKTAENHIASWEVPYTAGTLKTVSGKKTATLTTAGEPEKILLTPDKTNINDLCYITVNLIDANGIRNPLSEDLVKFEIHGPGTIIGVGNANPLSIESYQLPQRKTWKGRCLVILKSNGPGKITLTAKANGLPAASTTINTYR
jgi:beta-galactosidase